MATEIKIKKWEFEDFGGSFELTKNDWINIIDTNGRHVILHKNQISDMAETLEKEKSTE